MEGGKRRYIVSEVTAEAPKPRGFARGAEVTHWNGVPIARAVAANAEREAGSNAAARHAQGLAAMTIRWLGLSLPPDEDWVDVTYLPASDASGKERDARFEWHIFLQKSGTEHQVAQASARSIHLGMDARGEVERQVRNVLFGRAGSSGLPRSGKRSAGERLLQVLTPRAIEPCRFHFLNSTRTEQITRRRGFTGWHMSIAQSVETGAEYSQGLPLLPLTSYNDIGQQYQGPVVLITDALCYSTTDIFAAGFQDNGIGPILGIDENTGTGGANVWEYPLIAQLLRRSEHLPGKASLRFAVRRVTRIGKATGLPLEDLGVIPDKMHEFTRDDVLDRNVDLIAHAGRLLAAMPRQRLTATRVDAVTVRIESSNIDCVNVFLQGRPFASRKSPRSRHGSASVTLNNGDQLHRERSVCGSKRTEDPQAGETAEPSGEPGRIHIRRRREGGPLRAGHAWLPVLAMP